MKEPGLSLLLLWLLLLYLESQFLAQDGLRGTIPKPATDLSLALFRIQEVWTKNSCHPPLYPREKAVTWRGDTVGRGLCAYWWRDKKSETSRHP